MNEKIEELIFEKDYHDGTGFYQIWSQCNGYHVVHTPFNIGKVFDICTTIKKARQSIIKHHYKLKEESK